MTVGTSGDKAAAFKAALVEAAEVSMRSLELEEHGLLVRYGRPSKRQVRDFDDIVGVTRLASTINDGALSANQRDEDHTMRCTVQISVWRAGLAADDADDDTDPEGMDFSGGEGDLEKEANDRAYRLLRALEEHVRQTDKTLGGLVLWCRVESHESDGETDWRVLAKGRVVEVTAVFIAKARIRGPRAAL